MCVLARNATGKRKLKETVSLRGQKSTNTVCCTAPVQSSRPQNSPFPLSRHAVTAFQEIAGSLDEGCPKLGGISNTSEIAKKRDSENSNRVGKTCTHVLTYKS